MGSDEADRISRLTPVISIHAPRMGSDRITISFVLLRKISIHAPRMGSDLANRQQSKQFKIFQSTLPAWGATTDEERFDIIRLFQSTLPAWGATGIVNRPVDDSHISIHAPRMGSDSTAKAYSNDRIKWSTLREPHFFFSKNACFSPIVSMCAATSRTKKSENQSFIRIISRLGAYVLHLRLVSVPQIIEPYAVRLLVHQHFQCGTK